jgi:hypothetical protein
VWEGWCYIKYGSQRGQAAVELAILIPLSLVILAGGVQLARVFYTYHTLQKALRGGAGLLARASNVNYCNPADPAVVSANNFIVYGNLQGSGTEILPGLASFPIQIVPERQNASSANVSECPCGQGDADSCDLSGGGRAPDFVVVNLGTGYPLQLPFAYISLATINLRVSVRMPVTGG